jgi:surfeit locus 1 family protein
MPPGSLDLAAYAVSGEVTVEGIARRAQPRPDAALAPMDLPLPGETRINAWVRVDIDRMQTQIPYPLLPIFVARLPDDTTPPTALPRPPSYTTLDEGPHLTYAIQWFIFSGVLVVGYALLIRQELRK